MHSDVHDAVSYFHLKGGFNRLFFLFVEEVKRYGVAKGNVVLSNATYLEKECLDGIMPNIDFESKDFRIGLLAFERRLKAKTRFKNVDLVSILEVFFKCNIVSNKDREEEKQNKKEEFIREVSKYSSSVLYNDYIDSVVKKDRGYKRFFNLYNESPEHLKHLLKVIGTATELIPFEKIKHLAMFAAELTNDPHAFDLTEGLGLLLQDVLIISYEKKTGKVFNSNKLSIEELNEVLLYFNITRDDISSSVIVCGLAAIGKEPLSHIHAAAEDNSVLILPLCEILKVDKFTLPFMEEYPTLYLFENPVLFKVFIDKVKEEVGFYPPAICTSGQFSYAVWKLLDRLVPYHSNIIIKTNFDVDPEGLLMNDKLYKRYGKVIVPIAYSELLHSENISGVIIKKKRLNQLNNLQNERLKVMGDSLKQTPIPSFQENYLDLLIKDALIQYKGS
ncbi:DUF2399 domain-containing protein [Mesobacillus foraminis]|uniref:TIGR02679 domain-containing protein n=1 Tax=Mesobacillus foraminis TaxID=279826 RepID=UPI001BE6CC84|nr:TIGR02679 domain-containing protein [Mesobacillus foraminis]MBT2759297.1 DUF2399 domain-containing protein [Mesobacillus foraminis]